jgi:hypothetical protein
MPWCQSIAAEAAPTVIFVRYGEELARRPVWPGRVFALLFDLSHLTPAAVNRFWPINNPPQTIAMEFMAVTIEVTRVIKLGSNRLEHGLFV